MTKPPLPRTLEMFAPERTAVTGPVVIGGHEVLFDAAEIARRLEKDDVIGIDSETTGFSPWRAHVATVQLYGEQTGTAGLVRAPDGVVPEPIAALLKQKKTFVVHNGISFDIPFFHMAGLDVDRCDWYDTLVGETAVTSSQRRDVSRSLKASSKRRLGIVLDKEIDHGHWADPELSLEQVEYAMQDVLHLPALRRAQLEQAAESDVLDGLNFEMSLVLPTAYMTITGLPLGMEQLNAYLRGLAVEATALRPQFDGEFGGITTRQHAKLKAAFQERGIDIDSTAAEVLQDLVLLGGEAGRLADLVLRYRAIDHDLKMYDAEWVAEHVGPDGRIHPKFWLCSTDTTRYSSSEPNAQQIPQKMRGIFGWVDGHRMVSIDYSQIEIRIIAKLANDEALQELLQHDDVHAAIAAAMFKIPVAEVAPDQRKLAKAISFTILFGGGTHRLYEYTRRGGGKLSLAEAQDVVNTFFERFGGISRMRDAANLAARTKRMVAIRIPSGLKRILAGHQLRTTTLLNTKVQSTAAVGIKKGILEAHRRGLMKGYVGLQLHDELVATVPEAQAEEYAAELHEAMITGMQQTIDCNAKAKVKRLPDGQLPAYWMD